MASVADLAYARQKRLIRLSDAARARALRLWRTMNFDQLDASWSAIEAPISDLVSSAQASYAASSGSYTASVSRSYGQPVVAAELVYEAFVGVDGYGRDVGGILSGAVAATKTAAGVGRQQALLVGQAYLAAMVKTLIADSGRSADRVSAAGRGFTRYVRVVQPGGCSRCAILAGSYTAATPFRRHPSCQCISAPFTVASEIPDALHASPEEHFEALSEAEQDRIYTRAGAQAIRAGASPIRVVNARRGYTSAASSHSVPTPVTTLRRMTRTVIGYRPNGSPVTVYSTVEGASRRGYWGRRNQGRVRLMPEEIFAIAGDDLATAQAFLRDAGYIAYPLKSDDLRRADRILVNRATLRYGNFTLG